IPNLTQGPERPQRLESRRGLRFMRNRRRAAVIGNWLVSERLLSNRRPRSAGERYRRVGLDCDSAFKFEARRGRGTCWRLQREAGGRRWLVQVAPRCALQTIAALRALSDGSSSKAGTRAWLRANLRQKLRHRPCLHQRRPYRLAHEIVNHGLLPETHLGFRRVHIHIHFGGRHLNKEQNDGIHRRRQNVPIRLGDPVLNETVANQPPIHKNKNRIAIELLNLRLGNKTVQPHLAEIGCVRFYRKRGRRFAGGGARATRVSGTPPRWRLRQADTLQRLHRREWDQLIKCLASKHLVHALAMTGYWRRHEQGIRRRVQLEVLLRMRQRVVGYERSDVGQLGRFRSQKFLARRSIKEEIANRDRSSQREARFFHADDLAAVNFEDRPGGFLFSAGFQIQPGDRSNGRQGLAAKS